MNDFSLKSGKCQGQVISSLIQGHIDWKGRHQNISICRMHDLLHNRIQKISGNFQDNDQQTKINHISIY